MQYVLDFLGPQKQWQISTLETPVLHCRLSNKKDIGHFGPQYYWIWILKFVSSWNQIGGQGGGWVPFHSGLGARLGPSVRPVPTSLASIQNKMLLTILIRHQRLLSCTVYPATPPEKYLDPGSKQLGFWEVCDLLWIPSIIIVPWSFTTTTTNGQRVI